VAEPGGLGNPAPVAGAARDRRGWTTVASPWRNTRDNIIEKASPLLEKGEVVAHVVRAMEGPNRWAGIAIAALIALPVTILLRVPVLAFALFIGLFTSFYPRRLILATDRALVVLKGGRWRWTPKEVLDRLDIETKIGPLQSFWRYTVLDGRRLYVVPRTYPEVQAADADVDAA
jgi:hypothetical protein